MTAPKSRGTKSKRDKKRLHILLKKPNLVKCKKCGKSIRSHTICGFCGYYKGRKVLNILSKKEKEEIKKTEAENKAKKDKEVKQEKATKKKESKKEEKKEEKKEVKKEEKESVDLKKISKK